ncbi:MAG: DUF4292 domain-containing protein [Mangrovibacterium sp.]
MKRELFQYKLLFVCLSLFVLYSCRAPRELGENRLKNISTGRLIRNVEEHAFDYRGLEIKRINCLFETPKEKSSFRASLESYKNEYILLSLSKINLPVARVLLTPDSIRIINYFEKTYLSRDYGFLDDFFNTDVNFQMIQTILTNDVFSYRDESQEQEFREFVSYTDSGHYVLQSLKTRKLEKLEKKGKDDKVERYLKKRNEDKLIVQTLYIDPVRFRVSRIMLEDREEERNLTIRFSDFEPVDGMLYPGNIRINYTGPDDFVSLKLRLGKFSTRNNRKYSFKVPERYVRVN